jgi:cell division transport system permease protein
VQDQKALLEKFFKVPQLGASGSPGACALLMILVSVILIVNTIRVAAFSRRRETGS